jgi:hypothetical protein
MTILSMLFKGVPGDEHVYQSDFDGSGWSAPLVIPEIVTPSHPMWARYYDQTLLTAWREAAPPHNVQAARFDGPGFWTWFGAIPGATSDAAPSGAAMAGLSHFLLAWKGAGTTAIHYALFDSLHWAAPSIVPDAATSHAPAVARFGNQIHLVWKGAPGDHGIHHAVYDGVSWSAPQLLPGFATTSQPALATYGDRLVMAWKGKEGDSAIYWSSLASGGGAWLPQTRIGAFETGTGPAILEFAGRLHLVWKGVGDDYSVFMANYDGNFWWRQHQVPGVASSSTPSLAEFDPAF